MATAYRSLRQPAQRLNAFGQPMRGSKIRGGGALERARGYAFGALTTDQRGQYGSQKNFQAAAEDAMDRQAMEPEEEEEPAPETPELEATSETKPSLLDAPNRFIKPTAPMQEAQNKPAAPSRQKWSDGTVLPGMGKVPLVPRPSPLKPRVNWEESPFRAARMKSYR